MHRSLWLVLLLGCSHSDLPDRSLAAPDAGSAPAVHDAGRSICEVPLELEMDERADPVRAYIRGTVDGEPRVFLVDTGSQVSFIPLPSGSPDQLDIAHGQFGCLELPLAGRAIPIEERTSSGDQVSGIIGADVFLTDRTELDLAAGHLRQGDLMIDPTWRSMPWTNVFGFLFVSIVVDEQELFVAADTGAPHILWLGEERRAGDAAYPTQDGYGNELTLWQGRGQLALGGGAAREVSVVRAPSFPSLEDSNRLIEVDSDGLLGLSSFANRRIIFDPESERLWAEP